MALATRIPLGKELHDNRLAEIWSLCEQGEIDAALSTATTAHLTVPWEPNYCYAAARICQLRDEPAAVRAWVARAGQCPHPTAYNQHQQQVFRALVSERVPPEWFARWDAEHPTLSGPVWQGEPLPHGTLLIHRAEGHAEGGTLLGYGDILMSAALVPHCARLVGRLVLDVPRTLRALFEATCAHLPNVVIADYSSQADAEARTSTCRPAELPAELAYDRRTSWFFGIRSIRGLQIQSPVLRVSPGATEPCLGPGFHVGLAWAASDADKMRGLSMSRSAPLCAFAETLSTVPNVVLHALQVGPATKELAPYPEIRRYDFETFADTARLVVHLDAVLSVDTSVCHLAAGLGIATLTALAWVPCWTWGLGGDSTPWYPTMRLLRQRRPGDWVAVGERAAHLLETRDLPPRLAAPIAAREAEQPKVPVRAVRRSRRIRGPEEARVVAAWPRRPGMHCAICSDPRCHGISRFASPCACCGGPRCGPHPTICGPCVHASEMRHPDAPGRGPPDPVTGLTVAFISGRLDGLVNDGYGDILQSLQCLEAVAGRVDRVVVAVPLALDALVRASTAHLRSVHVWCTEGDEPPPVWGPITYRASWSQLMGYGPPDGQPYLVLPPAPADPPLARESGRHLGICWGAEALHPMPWRSLPLATLAPPLLAIPDIVLHSLQVGPAAAELEAFPSIHRHELRTFTDTARLALQCEAVVSVDTSVCHLAGGLGVPTVLVLSHVADRRWGQTGEKSCWYRSMRLVRQPTPGDWVSAAAAAAQVIASGGLPPRLALPERLDSSLQEHGC